MRQIYIILCVLIALIGCSAEAEFEPELKMPVGFGVQVDQTKGSLALSKDQVLSMGVFSLYTATPFPVAGYARQMENILVHRPDKDKVFTYSPISYWPESGYLSFFAYSPFASTDNGIESPRLTSDGYMQLDFQPVEDVSKQADLMAAVNLNRERTTQMVDLPLKHILSAIQFKGSTSVETSNYKVRVLEIELTNLINKGTFTYSASATEWLLNPDLKQSFKLSVDDKTLLDVALKETPVSLVDSKTALMILPQEISAGQLHLKAKLEITESGKVSNKYIDIDLFDLLNRFTISQKYVLTLSHETESKVKVSYEVVDWDKKIIDMPSFN
ncbi:MAG: fimbrillin family protein [Bacteroidales bacterium]